MMTLANNSSFKKEFPFQERLDEANRVLSKYTDRIPIICEKSKFASNDAPDIDKKKYLVPRDLTMGQFLYVVRKRLKLPAEKALFLFVNGSIPSTSQSISEVYEMHKDKDLFLYTTYSQENVFGAKM
jgi:GABA(A) receptor-associated protein